MATTIGLTFSQTYGLILDGSEDWFDPCLILDTPLCIDPFLMLDLEEDDEFKGAHEEVVRFFQRQYERVAANGPNLSSPEIRQVIEATRMPEAEGLFLGYSVGVKGAGSGHKLARLMVQAIVASIALGLKDIKHFEEITILGEGIGPDRISDATAGITKWRFARYTTRVCTILGVPLSTVVLDRARYDIHEDRWVAVKASLPLNPRSGLPVLLTPKRFLRHLPTLGSNEFASYAERRWREEHRDALAKKLVTFDRDQVLEQARKSDQTRQDFMAVARSLGGQPYDFSDDHWGVTTPNAAARHVADHPFEVQQPTSASEMKEFVTQLARYFKHYVEEQGGWELLWDERRPKPERAVQRLMLGVVFLICQANDISVDPEANVGRGPVDFKFSRGFKTKCLLETKLASNTKWIRGVTKQLPTYVVADVGKHGVYVLVSFDPVNTDNINRLREAVELAKNNGVEIAVETVQAIKKPSASKL